MTDAKNKENANPKEGDSSATETEKMPTFPRDPTSTKPVPDTDRRKFEKDK